MSSYGRLEHYVADCPKCKGHYTSDIRWEYCPRCRMRLTVSVEPVGHVSTRRRVPDEKPALTIAEVAELTGFSRQTITRLFQAEKGVIVIEHPEKMHKRGYRSVRIPRAVFDRVIRRLTV
jgi:predicted DNA-binding transcriptional regulator AlpA